MNRIIRNSLSVCFGIIKCALIKGCHCSRFSFGKLPRISLYTEIALDKDSQLNIGSRLLMRGGARIRVSSNAVCKLGDNVALGPNVMIACHKLITIGNNVQLSPNVQIYDHDHDFRYPGGLKENHYTEDAVEIGDNVWIGANAVILKGTRIADNCVVAANSTVKGLYNEKNMLIVQKRSTECIPIRIKAEEKK